MINNKMRTVLVTVCLAMAVFIVVPVNSKAAKTRGWSVENGETFYYKKGQRLIGLQTIGQNQYYFDLNTGKMIKSRWRKLNNKYYFFGRDGKMAKKCWVGSSYYVDKKGVRVKNKWVGKRFLGENGKWIKNFRGGWQKIDGKWYFYTPNGVKKTGWIRYNGERYYLNQNGVRMTRLQTINNRRYFFTKKGVLKNSGWIKSGSWYYYANEKGIINTAQRMNAAALSQATVMEYNGSTMKLRIEKFCRYGTYYWTARVKIQSMSQMKAALSYGTYGGTRQTTSSAVKSNNALIGINGSAFSYDTGKPGFDAVMLKDNKIYNKAMGTSYSLMAIGADGTMFTPKQGLTALQLKRDGVLHTFNFGPVLLENGAPVSLYAQGYPQVYASPDMTGKYPRAAVGMVQRGEYVMLVSNAPGLTLAEMRTIFKQHGCTYAYNLDGGGSVTMAYQGYVLNSPTDGVERPCGDFLLFAR